MTTQKYTYWQDEEMWMGYLEGFPDYWTQGESEVELKETWLTCTKISRVE